MKPFEELTRRGRLRRYRQLAQVALDAYGLTGARLRFIRSAGNVTFRVDASDQAPLGGASERYYRNHCVLRIHEPGYQTPEAIRSELEWLAALRRDTDLAVPEPVRTLDGALSVEIGIAGVPQRRRCSLLRWMKGQMLTRGLGPGHLSAVGRLMAGLHQHAAHWQRPAAFARPRYDWEGLFGDNSFVQAPASEVWSRLPRAYYEPFETVTNQLRQVMDEWGQGPDAFGLIHADLATGANVLFWSGEARAIDFDDCALGYWMFDVGVALADWRQEAIYPQLRDALLDGYAEIRALPQEQLAHLDLFIAAWHAFEMYWATAGAIHFPGSRAAYEKWVERAAQDLVRTISVKRT